MTLKLKSKIYKLTGIYLAQKEELEYIKSKTFWANFELYLSYPGNDMSFRDIQGLLIGLWQAKHSFTRRYSPSRKLRKKK